MRNVDFTYVVYDVVNEMLIYSVFKVDRSESVIDVI